MIGLIYAHKESLSDFFFAIGHSTRPIQDFLKILKAHEVSLLADVRTIPHSRYNPQFDQAALKKELSEAGIKYRHLKSLGGLRYAKPDSVNTAWKNKSFRGYADYMQTPEFEKGIEGLLRLNQKDRVAFMCAEGNPFRCHRLLLGDALTARGFSVYHISSPRSKKLHLLTPFAKIAHQKVIYP